MDEFFGREQELKRMRTALNRPSGSLIAVYGRRRVGKSKLIQRSLLGQKGLVISFVAREKIGYEANLVELTRRVKEALHNPYLAFPDLQSLLLFLYEQAKEKEIDLVLDEFPFLMVGRPGILSEIQEVVDAEQEKSHLNLILSGSSFGAMRSVIDDPSPLYGRFAEIVHVVPFDYWDARKFYPNLEPEKAVAYYAVFGGVPYYLKNLDFSLSFEENLLTRVIPVGSFFENEVKAFALGEVQKEISSASVLSSIAHGKRTYTDINELLPGKGANKATYPLDKLTQERLIEKLVPINQPSKRASYYIVDPMVEFYFTYLESYLTERTFLSEERVLSLWKDDLEKRFTPKGFEKICREYLIRRNKMGLNDPYFTDIGHYAYFDKKGKENGEYDIVTKCSLGYTDYECKYLDRPLSEADERNEQEEAEKRGISFQRFGFFSKKGFEPGAKKEECYSLEDVYSLK